MDSRRKHTARARKPSCLGNNYKFRWEISYSKRHLSVFFLCMNSDYKIFILFLVSSLGSCGVVVIDKGSILEENLQHFVTVKWNGNTRYFFWPLTLPWPSGTTEEWCESKGKEGGGLFTTNARRGRGMLFLSLLTFSNHGKTSPREPDLMSRKHAGPFVPSLNNRLHGGSTSFPRWAWWLQPSSQVRLGWRGAYCGGYYLEWLQTTLLLIGRVQSTVLIKALLGVLDICRLFRPCHSPESRSASEHFSHTWPMFL